MESWGLEAGRSIPGACSGASVESWGKFQASERQKVEDELLSCRDEMPDRSPARREGSVWVFQFVKGMARPSGEDTQLEPEVAGDTVSEVGRHRELNAGVPLTSLCVFILRPQPVGRCHPHSGWVFIPQLKLPGYPP